MTDQEQPKRRGRPPKYAGEGKRQNFSFRIRDKVRDRLIAAVADTGRSLSEEIEHRIEQSFEMESLMDALAEKAVAKALNLADTSKGTRASSPADFNSVGGMSELSESSNVFQLSDPKYSRNGHPNLKAG